MNKLKVSVIGAGSFGTALGSLSARCGHKVLMYCKNKQTMDEINNYNKNTRYFPDSIALNKNIKATDDIEECLKDCAMVIHAIPVQNSYDFLKEYGHLVPENTPYVISSKGILLKQKKFFSEVWEEIFPKERNIHHCVLSGPSFAIEIINNTPTVVTLACKNKEVGRFVQQNLHTSSFKSYITDDIRGVEIGGALKNPLAIAAGISDGLGYGINTSSALITRGIREMSLFSEKFGGRQETLYGLSGIGDVMLTCLGKLSRNKAVGLRIAEGKSIDDIMESGTEVAEGVPTSFVLDDIIKKENLNMPIFKTYAMVIKGKIQPDDAMKYLMLRDLEGENELRI